MKILSFSAILVVAISANLNSQTQPLLPHPLDSLVISGTDMIMRQEYDAAFEHFRQVSAAYPASPVGFLFQAATLQARAADFRVFEENETFDSLLNIARDIAEEMVEKEPNSPWARYFLGTVLGMDSYDRIQRGDFFGGYFKSRASVSEIEETLELDSTFYDCYSILGTYYYWKSRKTEFLDWLPFFSDDREQGIRYLHLAVQNGRYQRFPALSNLVWVYLDAAKHDSAEVFARMGLRHYPNQRTFLHALGSSLSGQKRYAEAKDAFERQLQEILNAPHPNEYNEIGARVNVVFMKRTIRDTTDVRRQLSIILSKKVTDLPDYLQGKVEPHMQMARRFQQELDSGTFPGQK
ncbi:MAG: hypothetical protein L0Y80_03290 [Ignavibacteriae bacterium]|nr:hypothetical protein [Ignavibacteriota bacterium]